MASKVAINGLGRIGRAALKLVLEEPQLELVAVNEIGSLENMVYLLKYDTVYGRYERQVGWSTASWSSTASRWCT